MGLGRRRARPAWTLPVVGKDSRRLSYQIFPIFPVPTIQISEKQFLECGCLQV